MRLKHIGCPVFKEDITNFYIDILKGKEAYSFTIPSELNAEIFGIAKEVQVHNFIIGEITLELFEVDNSASNQSYNHICVATLQHDEIAKNAISKGYSCYARKKEDGNTTYFIKDKAGNLFELK